MKREFKQGIEDLRGKLQRGQAAEALAEIEEMLTHDHDSAEVWRLCELAGAASSQLLNAEGGASWYLRAGYNDTILRSQREHLSNYLFALHYLPGLAPDDLARQHRGYAMLYQDEEMMPARPPRSEGPLHIGYLAPDLQQSSSSLFFDVMLTGLDPERYRVYAYSLSDAADEYTGHLRAGAGLTYRSLSNRSMAEAADIIWNDGIDGLGDRGGHSQGGDTLRVAARRPAPVNVTGIGYFSTTGLPCSRMDYFLTDGVMDAEHHAVPGLPENDDIYFSEQLLRLPHGFCFTPTPAMQRREPRLRTARPDAGRAVVFAAMGNFLKINEAVLRAWHRIMMAVPGSRLVLQDTMCLEVRRRMLETRMRHYDWGQLIDAGRVELRLGSDDYLAEYSALDIVLDTFPYTGGATTATALYMGAPVVTLAGDHHSARIGASLLTAAQHEEWIAHDEQEYCDIAVRLAADRDRLAQQKLQLRSELMTSPLLDRCAYARALEEVYDTIANIARVQARLKNQAGNVTDEGERS